MTAEEKRARLAPTSKPTMGRNIYSQDGNRRECCYKGYKDGEHYSDCSSFVRLTSKEADIDLPNIGSSTIQQYQNKAGKIIECAIVKGVPQDIDALEVGDCLYFAGTDKKRAYVDFVGHVEMVIKIDRLKGNVTLRGHGSGNPHDKDMVTYCKSRYAAKTDTKRGNKGLLCVKRFIPDDPEAAPADPLKIKHLRVVAPSVNLRADAGVLYPVVGYAKMGDVLACTGKTLSTWAEVIKSGRTAWISTKPQYTKYV